MKPEEYRALRESMNLTQTALGELVGVSWNTIARRERGEAAIDQEAALALRCLAEHIRPAGEKYVKREIKLDMVPMGLVGGGHRPANSAPPHYYVIGMPAGQLAWITEFQSGVWMILRAGRPHPADRGWYGRFGSAREALAALQAEVEAERQVRKHKLQLVPNMPSGGVRTKPVKISYTVPDLPSNGYARVEEHQPGVWMIFRFGGRPHPHDGQWYGQFPSPQAALQALQDEVDRELMRRGA